MNRSVRDLARALARAAEEPCAGKGGWPDRIRRYQPLMREAAQKLAQFSNTQAKRARRQPGLFDAQGAEIGF